MSASEAKKGAGALEPSHPAGSVLDAGDYKAGDDAVERFRELLRIPTVSRDDKSLRDDEPFRRWAPTLRRLFPRFFEVTELTTIDDFGMLLRWPGADPSLDPVVMMAHQDVVPVDTKCIAAAFFEAAEHLVGQGYVPPRDVWFFSSDGEEVAAPTCAHAVEWFRAHGIHPYMVLDEGGAVAADAPLGVDVPVAMVGVSEKGHVDLTVTAYADGGHASTPSANDACRLLCRVCEHISAVTKIMAASPETAAMLRTTYALTQMEGSPAHNVLPPVARANFNVRVAPFESIADAVERARKLAAQQCQASGLTPDHVTVEIDESIPYMEPAPISPYEDDAAFDYIHRCVSGVYPEAGFAPYVQNSCTDSHEFNAICERVYRFCGFIYSAEARGLLHAANERIGVDVYKRGIEFYVAFLANLARM